MITGQLILKLEVDNIHTAWTSVIPVTVHAHAVPPLEKVTFLFSAAKRLHSSFRDSADSTDKAVGGFRVNF